MYLKNTITSTLGGAKNDVMLRFVKPSFYMQFKRLAILTAFLAFWPGAALGANIGQSEQFFVNKNYDQISRTQLTATLRVQGEHALVYLDDRFLNGITLKQAAIIESNLKKFISEFDSNIYPTETVAWGSEPNPGIDGDPKIVILVESLLPGFGGYFDGIHQFSTDQAPNSNRREIIFVSADALLAGNASMYAAHEFQHLISFNQKEVLNGVSEEIWLNETRSEYSTSLTGYNRPLAASNLSRRSSVFTREPEDNLLRWENTPTDYGNAMMLGEYLVGRYGQGILADTLRSKLTGSASINTWLAGRGERQKFSEVVNDWAVASAINIPGDSRYGYGNTDLAGSRVAPGVRQSLLPKDHFVTVVDSKPWQSTWHEFTFPEGLFDGAAKFKLGNSEPSHSLVASVVTFQSNGKKSVRQTSFDSGNGTIYVTVDAESDVVSKVLIVVTDISDPEDKNDSKVTIASEMITDEALASARETEHNAVFTDEPAVGESSLIKRRGIEKEVYVVAGRYKRVLTPEAQALYGHLANQRPVEVDDTVFNSYITANYIRPESDKKVYAVWPDGTKHWLNMTGQQFTDSGRDWGAIFVISDAEGKLYKPGLDIKQ